MIISQTVLLKNHSLMESSVFSVLTPNPSSICKLKLVLVVLKISLSTKNSNSVFKLCSHPMPPIPTLLIKLKELSPKALNMMSRVLKLSHSISEEKNVFLVQKKHQSSTSIQKLVWPAWNMKDGMRLSELANN